MLLKVRILESVAAGKVDLQFRRWKRPTVRPGGSLRTAVGVLSIHAVDPVSRESITEEDARRAGYPSRASLLAELDAHDEGQVYRIELSLAGPDPREELRERSSLSEEERAELRRNLERLDARSPYGPWTLTILRLIGERPATRAADLAASLGRDTPSFKVDVRKLKELGLTESLEKGGYRLSPRGRAYFAASAVASEPPPGAPQELSEEEAVWNQVFSPE